MNDKYVIETSGLSKAYGEETILYDIDLHIKKGKIYGLLGRNGVGKTTIMKMMLGLTAITSGEISLFGKSVKKNGMDIYPRVGSLVEAPGFYPNLTGYENLKTFSLLKGHTKRNSIEDALKTVDLPYRDKKPFGKYSLGMKQRLGVANALMNEPEILILDEPTNGLDPIGIAELRQLIKDLAEKQGKTVLISSHQLSEVEQLADTIGVLHDKRLIEECDLDDIIKYNQQYIRVKVSNVEKATMLLEQTDIQNYKVIFADTIHIYDFSLKPYLINRLFTENDVDVSQLDVHAESLEEHFKDITGGVGIA